RNTHVEDSYDLRREGAPAVIMSPRPARPRRRFAGNPGKPGTRTHSPRDEIIVLEGWTTIA
ncbi:hypothetical protein THAOC_18839, partial [Thalassiosira oceanica]